MQFAQGVLTHTPLWVFAFFVYLVWQGILSLRSRELPIWRLLVVPALFMILGISRIALRQQGEWPVVCWLIGLALLAPLGFATGPRILSIDRANARITRSGSRIPLIRNIVVFALQYGFAVASALAPDGRRTLTLISCAVSGGTAGYFAGWVVALWRRYSGASEPKL